MKTNVYYEVEADDISHFNFHYAIGYIVPAHFHNNTEIIFVNKGEFNATINGKEIVAHEHDIIIVNSFDVHYYTPNIDCEFYVLVFGDSYKYESKILFENYLESINNSTEIFKLLEVFYNLYNEQEKKNFSQKIGFINLVLGILEKVYADKIIKTKYLQNDFTEILKYIQENSESNLQISEISMRFGYSKTYFSSLFSKMTGMCFRDYLNRIRLEKLEYFLKKNTKISICEAALKCGFGSLNSYYRAKNKFN